MKKTLPLTVLGAATATALVAGCGGAGSQTQATGPGHKGGTLTYYMSAATNHTDPQRTYIGRDITNWTRMVYRQLVAFPISTDPSVANKPIADLATNTGTSSNGAKTWKFTLKSDVTWQDGKPVTCADLKYGASRSFATSVITGGPNYMLTYLDIPTDPKTGLPAYTGPYGKVSGQKYFDKAITCNGNTITYHFKKPWPDFPLAIAALHMVDPFRKDKDQGDKSNFQIFSDGPYELQGSYDPKSGATFVRNPNYKASSDNPQIRKALPNKIIFDIGKTTETITSLLIADTGAAKDGVTSQLIPPSYYSKINGSVAKRSVQVLSPYVDYLAVNMHTPAMKNLKVRQALSLATNDEGWINAGGGPKAYAPASSVVNPSIQGYKPNPAFKRPSTGDVAAAKKLLQESGVKMPVAISFTYPSTATADSQAAALQQTWDQAGFKVTLNGVANQNAYYTDIQAANQPADIVWAGWGADWPSAITVTPPLFDSRPNLTKTGNGNDYGRYKSAAFNKLMDEAYNASSLTAQTTALQQADALLGRDVAYIPLEIQRFYMLHGSGVTGFLNTPASNGYPDLGGIGVSQ